MASAPSFLQIQLHLDIQITTKPTFLVILSIAKNAVNIEFEVSKNTFFSQMATEEYNVHFTAIIINYIYPQK